ncbi:hypothetical protein FRC15_003443 [Serendipita sp. 397]|nr:hypothetical protein FRC15_003443 [Serendipita sp. 397]
MSAAPSSADERDYTDGASAQEIQNVVQQTVRRGESQVGGSYQPRRSTSSFRGDEEDTGGAIFDGPGSVTIPSSVTGLRSTRTRSFNTSSRRGSRIYRASSIDDDQGAIRPSLRRQGTFQSGGTVALDDSDDDGGSPIQERRGRRGRISTDETEDLLSQVSERPRRTSMFGGFSSFFGRRESPSRKSNASQSRAGSVDYTASPVEEDDRWGYHSSEEEDASGEDVASVHGSFYPASSRGSHSRPASPSNAFPGLGRDPIFGDTRIDMEEASLAESLPPTTGPPTHQDIYIADEDLKLRLLGYKTSRTRDIIWKTLTLCSLGTLGLLGHWFPPLWLWFVSKKNPFHDRETDLVVVENTSQDIVICHVETVPYPYSYSSTFPDPAQASSTIPSASNGGTRPSSVIKMAALTSPMIAEAIAPDEELKRLRMFEYRYSRYLMDPRTGLWFMAKDWREKPSTLSETLKGLPRTDREQRRILFGSNLIDIKGKSIPSLLIEEVIHPFYVFQIASIILWSIDDYYYYAFCIAIISTFSILSTLVETISNMKRMREMARFSCLVRLINREITSIRDSSDLVPGDIIDLSNPPLVVFPCDIILMAGDAIVNESMLTGESVPISKMPVKGEDLDRWRRSGEVTAQIAKSVLYAGTKVIRIRGPAQGQIESPAIGLVARTGFNTTKGALVRSMLFPKPIGFKFYRDSMRFIAVLAGIAIMGFMISAVQFIRLGVPWHTIVLRALDLITVVVPPALPATLSIGTSFAISRLRANGIFCISPTRVNVGGKVNVVCFDKTGTLTEDGLDILGARALERDGKRFREIADDVLDIPLSPDKANILHAMATCHSLKVVDGAVVGDPLDAKMFEFTGWTLEESTTIVPIKKNATGEGTSQQTAPLVQNIVRPPGTRRFTLDDALKGDKRAHFLELGVIRTFEFVSALRRMTVITKRLKSKSMEVYLKGAPEILHDVCDPTSFPIDYEDLLSYYTRNGYRVIGIAGKSIDGLSWLKAQRMKRENVEVGLQFLGFLIFENKLKPGTTPAIAALRQAHLGCRMVTGDNPRTAVSVARECKLINSTAFVFYPSFLEGDSTNPRSILEWRGVDDESLRLDPYSLRPLAPPPHVVDEDRIYRDYDLAITGDVFRWMIDYAPMETLQQMLYKTHVFARMSPDEKHELVERLQSIGYTVAFCGDGANDCGALKAADIGISLSEAEASVAAPFTSKTPDIGCVIEVIKEGRAALVTSFSCFKYMALYSLIQFTTITFLYSFASSLGDFQFLYIDLFIIIPVAVAMGRTLPYERIHTQRPTSSLVSRKVLSSIVGQILITSGAQMWAFFWVRAQPWYQPPPPAIPGEGLETHNYENTVLFLVSSFQYILVAAVFSIGPPFRRPIWTNGWLVGCLIVLSLFSTWVLLAPTTIMTLLLDLVTLPLWPARFILAAAVLVNVAASFTYERWLHEPIAAGIKTLWGVSGRRRRREGRIYEAVGRN